MADENNMWTRKINMTKYATLYILVVVETKIQTLKQHSDKGMT